MHGIKQLQTANAANAANAGAMLATHGFAVFKVLALVFGDCDCSSVFDKTFFSIFAVFLAYFQIVCQLLSCFCDDLKLHTRMKAFALWLKKIVFFHLVCGFSFRVCLGIVFNCNVNIRSCGSCVAFRRRFNQCSWCPSTESCTASTSCSGKITSISSCSTGNIISVNYNVN